MLAWKRIEEESGVFSMQKLVQKQKTDSRLALKALQMTYQLHQLKEYLMMAAFTLGGAVGRIMLQGVPSVEPITFIAVLAGSLFGKIRGAMIGASAWFLSNFFIFGGHGPWSIIQVAAGFLAGYLGGFAKGNLLKALGAILLSTIGFELMMNLGSSVFFGLAAFLTAIPFTLIHIISNVGMGILIPWAYRVVKRTGKLDEKAICKEYMDRLG